MPILRKGTYGDNLWFFFQTENIICHDRENGKYFTLPFQYCYGQYSFYGVGKNSVCSILLSVISKCYLLNEFTSSLECIYFCQGFILLKYDSVVSHLQRIVS